METKPQKDISLYLPLEEEEKIFGIKFVENVAIREQTGHEIPCHRRGLQRAVVSSIVQPYYKSVRSMSSTPTVSRKKSIFGSQQWLNTMQYKLCPQTVFKMPSKRIKRHRQEVKTHRVEP